MRPQRMTTDVFSFAIPTHSKAHGSVHLGVRGHERGDMSPRRESGDMSPHSKYSGPFAASRRVWPVLFIMAALWLAPGTPRLSAQTTQVVYDDQLENGWQLWGWATISLTNTSPVHSGSYSISVTSTTNYQALYLHAG